MKNNDQSIYHLFEGFLNRMLQAEEDILKQLQLVSEEAESADLKTIFNTHMGETKNQIERLKDSLKNLAMNLPKEEEGVVEKGKKALKTIAKSAFFQKSEAIQGIIKEGAHVYKEYEDTNLHDYVLSSGAQTLEMGEIAAYKTLISMANEFGFQEIQKWLEESLKEEEKAYQLLKDFSKEEASRLQKSA